MDVDRRAIRRSLRTAPNPNFRQRVSRVVLRTRQASHVPAYLLGGELDRPIFIIGAPRSGTSLLTVIIAESSRIRRWPGEGHEIWEADHHPALRGWDSNVLGPADLTPESATRIRRSFFLISGARYRLLDKAPRNVMRVDWVDAIFPTARFIFLKRDGLDNVNSLINAWRSPRYRTYRLPEPHAIPGVDPAWWKFVLYPGWRTDATGALEVVCAKQWAISNELALDALERIDRDRWIELTYEDLIDRPVEETERLMRFVDLPFEDEVRAKAGRLAPINTVTPPERGKWRKENPDEIRSVSSIIEPTMERLGYPVDAH
ncbi:MAG: sulfotransferase [Actinomycetota bacterium]|nr:sulfotransferase [Actinomycetota bacterium]